MNTYEEILERISAMPNAEQAKARTIEWLTAAATLGVSRDQTGRLELFLAGPELKPRSPSVIDSMMFHSWHRDGGLPLDANRLLLPALGHFDQVGAFLCTELLRNGADKDIERAFAVTEPIIELSIERLQMSEAAMLGLVGEMLLLDALCRRASDAVVASIVDSWDGWRRSARDFSWGGIGVEVKTTSRTTSAHLVQGVHQIEPAGPDDDGNVEDKLVLVSIGLQTAAVQGSNSVSLPDLVQRLVDRLQATGNDGQVAGFLSRVAIYGSESGFGYDHANMADDAPFTTLFTVTFCRGYDMGDPGIEVLRSDDVSSHHHVDLQSVNFRVNLPAVVSALNPVNGANQVAQSILGC
ncbi:MAG: PD-(D/E)XK motif protein [Corynebacterium sp.]|uniref:PD-(D/E)XK motif protein n=1 Tax=Corynebacterium sp. TaxID=1720 RepID=UPI0026E058B0|nr:PD-(D/E)XK motif protein [Corynebacterium sp.]MDO5670112.1 PD-(D/E)XK motif protein [Corynebacterium sp.]